MAPATSAGATPEVRKGRSARWTRDDIIEAITEWTALYGEPPRAADWNPSAARWSAASWRIARYRKGRPDGRAWPSLNSAKGLFGGSLNAALAAAGFEPNKSGPKRRGSVTPELLERTEMAPAARAALDAARAEARAERARREAAERARAKADARLGGVREELRVAKRRASVRKTKTKVVRDRAANDAKLERARATADVARAAAKADVAEARMDAAEGRRAATRAAAKLERAEATITTLREERRALRRERDDAARDRARTGDRLVAADARLAAALDRIEALRRREVALNEGLRTRDAAVDVPAPETAALARAREDAPADLAARAAEERAARAERRYAELAHSVTGEARWLTRDELDELRRAGPAGPKVLADAIGALARARKTNNPHELRKALTAVASAAVSWKERL
jgi:hypothetical protein